MGGRKGGGNWHHHGRGWVVVGAGTVVAGAAVVVGAGTVVAGAAVVVGAGSVVVAAGTVVGVVEGVVGRVGDVLEGGVDGGVIGDVGVVAATVVVGAADDGGTGGNAARLVVVVVTPLEPVGSLSAWTGIVVGTVDAAVEAFAVVVGESVPAADVAGVDVDGALAIPGSKAAGKEVDGGSAPNTSERTSGPLPPPDSMIGNPRAATQPKAASSPLYLSTACATRLSRNPSNPSTTPNHDSSERP